MGKTQRHTPRAQNLNLRKLQQLAVRALRNGISLHFDSVLLYRNRSYATAHFISVLAMEELGKAFASEHCAWSETRNDRSERDFEDTWINWLLTDHRGKQLSFLREVVGSWNTPVFTDALHRQLEARKQNSVYVGFSKPVDGRPRTDGAIISPKEITRARARKQLKLVRDFLLEQVDGIMHGSIEYDLAAFNHVFNQKLGTRLRPSLR